MRKKQKPIKNNTANNVTLRIGHYVMGKKLGAGKFGVVKMGNHALTNHQVAIKIMNRKQIKSLAIVDKLQREIMVLHFLHHPHIIKLYQTINTPTDIFMVMEYVGGGELFHYIISKQRLSESESRRFFQQIISGISYCHKHRVVHRDLKPENLLLDHNLNIKIADFGLSNIMKDGQLMKTSCGSPNYASPEIISGNLYIGPEVDIWSCGIILYAMLSGSLPFDDSIIGCLFQKIKAGVFTFPASIPETVKPLIRGLLQVDSNQRLTLDEILEDTWFKVNLSPYLFDDFFHISENNDDATIKKVAELFHINTENVLNSLAKFDQSDPIVAAYRLLIDDNKEVSIYQNAKRIVNSIDKYSNITLMEDITPREAFVRKKWHIGINANGDSQSVINEVYYKLLSLNYEWRTVKPFVLEIRKKVGSSRYNYFGLQLYEWENKGYIVDMYSLPMLNNSSNTSLEKVIQKEELGQNSDEKYENNFNSIEFLEMCGDLIIELSHH